MEILDTFDFDSRPSRSKYAPVVKAIVVDKCHAAVLKRGVDFSADVKIDTVQAGVSTAFRKAGARARTYVVSPDKLVVGLNADPAPKRRNKKAATNGRREVVTA